MLTPSSSTKGDATSADGKRHGFAQFVAMLVPKKMKKSYFFAILDRYGIASVSTVSNIIGHMRVKSD